MLASFAQDYARALFALATDLMAAGRKRNEAKPASVIRNRISELPPSGTAETTGVVGDPDGELP